MSPNNVNYRCLFLFPHFFQTCLDVYFKKSVIWYLLEHQHCTGWFCFCFYCFLICSSSIYPICCVRSLYNLVFCTKLILFTSLFPHYPLFSGRHFSGFMLLSGRLAHKGLSFKEPRSWHSLEDCLPTGVGTVTMTRTPGHWKGEDIYFEGCPQLHVEITLFVP